MGEGKDWVSRQSFENIEIVSADGLKLRGFLLQSNRAAGRTAILAHGYSGKAKDMGAYAKIYYENLGFNILIPDARGMEIAQGITLVLVGRNEKIICNGLNT